MSAAEFAAWFTAWRDDCHVILARVKAIPDRAGA